MVQKSKREKQAKKWQTIQICRWNLCDTCINQMYDWLYHTVHVQGIAQDVLGDDSPDQYHDISQNKPSGDKAQFRQDTM